MIICYLRLPAEHMAITLCMHTRSHPQVQAIPQSNLISSFGYKFIRKALPEQGWAQHRIHVLFDPQNRNPHISPACASARKDLLRRQSRRCLAFQDELVESLRTLARRLSPSSDVSNRAELFSSSLLQFCFWQSYYFSAIVN